jgi:Phosphorylase superfamily
VTAPAAIILCPLDAEQKALRRSGRWPLIAGRASFAVSGPGPRAISQWFKSFRQDGVRGDTVILAGVAGGLSDQTKVGEAGFIGAIVDRTGGLLAEPFVPAAWGAKAWRVTSTDRPVGTPDAKRSLHSASNADVVDMESDAFASEAAQRGLRFMIVRGISDGVADALPDGVDTLVDASGRTRLGAALSLVARCPLLFGALRRLGQRTATAMDNVASLLELALRGAP